MLQRILIFAFLWKISHIFVSHTKKYHIVHSMQYASILFKSLLHSFCQTSYIFQMAGHTITQENCTKVLFLFHVVIIVTTYLLRTSGEE